MTTSASPTSSDPIRLLVIDRRRLALEAVTAALAGTGWAGSVSGATSFADAPLDCVREPPAVVLVAMHHASGLHELAALRDALPGVPTVAWDIFATGEDVVACVRAGATALLDSDADLVDLRDAVHALLDGRIVCSPALLRLLLDHVAAGAPRIARTEPPPATGEDHLTPREREVLVLIELGWSNKQIATELGVELRTVKNHVHNLLNKLRVSKRGEAAARLRSARVPPTRALQAVEPVA